jgi:hypothetical protein
MTALGKNRAQKMITFRFFNRAKHADMEDMGLQWALILGNMRAPALNAAEDCFEGRVDENVL